MSIEEQIRVLESIKGDGNIAFIKFDGERSNNSITVVIDFPKPSKRKLIRFDGDILTDLLDKLIKEYQGKDGI